MLGFRRQEGTAPGDGARQVLDDAVAALRRCQHDGTAAVPVADVLGLLGADPGPALPRVPRDPRADPLTGCKPVTPARP